MRRQGRLAQYVLYEHVQVRLFGWSGDENLAAHAKRRQVKVRLLRDLRQRHRELADGGEVHGFSAGSAHVQRSRRVRTFVRSTFGPIGRSTVNFTDSAPLRAHACGNSSVLTSPFASRIVTAST